jgi:hypothetical protein
MIHQCGDQDAGDDGDGLLEARREEKGRKLRLVAHFSQRDDTRRDEKGFHATRAKKCPTA